VSLIIPNPNQSVTWVAFYHLLDGTFFICGSDWAITCWGM